MNAVPRLFTLFELAWRGLSADEQGQLKKSLLKFVVLLATAGGLGGFIMATGLANVAHVSPVPGVEVNPINAFEPGTGFSVADYCKGAKTVTVINAPGAEVIGTKRVAENVKDADYIEWKDDGQNTSATRFFVNKSGKNDHELVQVVDSAAVACMRSQR